MSESELDLFNIETLLIESNSMESLENSLKELVELFSLSEEIEEMMKILMYKQYYVGRIDSNRSFITGMKDFVDKTIDITDEHREVIHEVITISENQLK